MIHPKEVPPEAILLAVYLELQNGNTQLALQIIKRNQLLPAVKTLSEMRKKPVFQPVHPIQPIQMPPFTVQRKWYFALWKLLPETQGSIYGPF